ncbi:MAG: hypothetical protein B1H08_06570 [Candidatus Omnitrophica bacterium 4484_171]|nr:MAG: hypothetical protein B1H08_06570 [Candidatus Omnitrophica bacterium 4484_171]
MRKKFLFCTLILLFFVFPAFSWQISSFQGEDSSVAEKNQIILNLVFVSLSYQREDNFKKDISSILARLKKTSPFREFKSLKVYLLDASPEERTVLFKKSESFPFLKVKNSLIQDIKSRIGGVYKLVLLNKQGDTSAAELSNIRNISLIILGKSSYGGKNRLSKVFLHELGHSLGLREENPGSSQPIIPGEPNCASDKETAKKWWGDMVKGNSAIGYFEIYSAGRKFIKPTRRSIMNNPLKSSGYGPVNERYLRRELGIKETD